MALENPCHRIVVGLNNILFDQLLSHKHNSIEVGSDSKRYDILPMRLSLVIS